MIRNIALFQRIWEYLTAVAAKPEPGGLERADGAFVFGRASPIVAERAAMLYWQGLVGWILVTGGIGKDSGPLKDLGLAEAVYVAALLRWKYGIPDEDIFVEDKASNGAENSIFGMKLLLSQNKREHRKIILVAHATSLRRLWACHLAKDRELGFGASYQLVATDYQFDPENPVDQKEAAQELLRLADWPEKGWAIPQPDFPADLVEFAREYLKG